MTITLTPETEARLRAKSERDGGDISSLAEHLILSALAWEAQDEMAAIAAIQKGELAAINGLEKPLNTFIAEQRHKHGFSEDWPDAIAPDHVSE